VSFNISVHQSYIPPLRTAATIVLKQGQEGESEDKAEFELLIISIQYLGLTLFPRPVCYANPFCLRISLYSASLKGRDL
jgi:hypothetical protein